MKITYLGQAGVLFETNGLRIVVDPYLSDSCGAQNPGQHRRQRISEAYLNLSPQVVICTHCHLDHLDPETLRHYLTPEGNVTAMAPGEGWRKLREFGGKNNYVLFNRHVEWTQGQAHFRAVKAVHSDPDAVGVILEAEGGRWYLSGDTLYSEEIFQDVQGHFDGVFLPVNGVGNNMNMTDAARFAAKLDADWVVPMHVGMFDALDAAEFSAPNRIVPRIYEEIPVAGRAGRKET